MQWEFIRLLYAYHGQILNLKTSAENRNTFLEKTVRGLSRSAVMRIEDEAEDLALTLQGEDCCNQHKQPT